MPSFNQMCNGFLHDALIINACPRHPIRDVAAIADYRGYAVLCQHIEHTHPLILHARDEDEAVTTTVQEMELLACATLPLMLIEQGEDIEIVLTRSLNDALKRGQV